CSRRSRRPRRSQFAPRAQHVAIGTTTERRLARREPAFRLSGAAMSRVAKRGAPVLLLLALGAVYMTARPSGQAAGLPSPKNGDWIAYTADNRGTKYSPL